MKVSICRNVPKRRHFYINIYKYDFELVPEHPNPFIGKHGRVARFRHETLESALSIAEKEDYLFTICIEE